MTTFRQPATPAQPATPDIRTLFAQRIDRRIEAVIKVDQTADESFAIAHGLEDMVWLRGTGDKWTARRSPPRTVDALVKERTSPAVKAALKSLHEAPAAGGGAKKQGRKGNAT